MFKKGKKRTFRRKDQSESDSDSDGQESTGGHASLEEMRKVQKLRKRTQGVSAEMLSQGLVEVEKQEDKDDPFKLKTGGYIDMKALKQHKLSSEEMEQIGTSFAAETNRRDEDADMLKYVEVELNKKKGITKEDEKNQKSRRAEDLLYDLPDNIKDIDVNHKKKSEDMLSNQMLSGIPEVDLGIEAKIKNIEQTEEAKAKLAEERRKKRNAGLQEFIPTNMAVNFVQHNRFNIEESYQANQRHQKKKEEPPKPAPVRVGDAERPPTEEPGTEKRPPKGEKATDDFHYEKFKKQLRRY